MKAMFLKIALLLLQLSRHLVSGRGSRGNKILCKPNYFQAYNALADIESARSCFELKKKYSVSPGKSWGYLPQHLQSLWRSLSCDEVRSGEVAVSCNDVWGSTMLSNWRKEESVLLNDSVSTVTCYSANSGPRFCKLVNVVVDFSKAESFGPARIFHQGFVTAFAKIKSTQVDDSIVSGFSINSNVSAFICDEWEHRPTFVMSHDDIFNLGHHMNDVMIVWAMIKLSKLNPLEALFLNFDGIRVGGPAGGVSHKIMNSSDPDMEGPFWNYYRAWFQETKRAVDYKTKKVCYKEIYFQPFPGVSWIWQDWGNINNCSMIGPSPIFQSFSSNILKHYRLFHGENALQRPFSKKINVLFQIRGIGKGDVQAVARLISDEEELLEAVRKIDGIEVQVIDFQQISFKEQIAKVYAADIMVGMHGAGNLHMMHMAVGQSNCCAFIEIIPNLVDFVHIEGHGNIARHLGVHYIQHLVPDQPSQNGSFVSISAIVNKIKKAQRLVQARPSCSSVRTKSVKSRMKNLREKMTIV